MVSRSDWQQQLNQLDRSSWPAFLDANSGLPGPRGNIELAMALADLADSELVDDLLSSGDEYRMFCGAICLGTSAAANDVAARMRALATEDRWRIREGVAIGLQRLGDSDPAALHRIVEEWVDDPDPLVQRAAIAAICEPRLLRDPAAAAVAIEACKRATSQLAARPLQTRREPGVRTLRQALGYCWSVAVAADPRPGLTEFQRLDDSDPDIAWIVTNNLRKKRLARLL